MSTEPTLFDAELERTFEEHPASVAKARREQVTARGPYRHLLASERDDDALVARFHSHVEEAENGCWLWTAALNNGGYGVFGITPRRLMLAHRVAYEFACGRIPDGLHLDHLCSVRACVNPAHLEPVTATENNRRIETGLFAEERTRTRCPAGHAYDPENTYVWRGQRHCRACRSTRDRARWQARVEARARRIEASA